ncbi:MAG: hypothetical protein ACFB0C_23755 [Leptolyngbyaceae cyanobacterium]
MSLLNRAFHLLLGSFTLLIGSGGFLWGLHRLQLLLFASRLHLDRKGKILAKGIACATDPNKIQTTPLSDTPCIAYQFMILEPRAALKSTSSQTTLYQESRGQWNLSLQTPRGKVKLKPGALDLDGAYFSDRQNLARPFSAPRSSTLLTEKGINPKPIGVRRSLNLVEWVIRDGDPIRVLGRIGDQPLCIEAAIVTDKSMYRVFTEAVLACLVGICFLWVALSVIGYAFR